MIPVILSAGRGSRIGSETEEIPKWFLDIGNKHVYDYQLSVLAEEFDEAYVVLGHGFAGGDMPAADFPTYDEIDLNIIIFDGWETVENAGTALFALEQVPEDDLLLICGDILFNHETIQTVIDQFNKFTQTQIYSAVAAIEGVQDSKTAVRWDQNGFITDYGAIEGHEEAGMFILNSEHIHSAREFWSENTDKWFPSVFPTIESKVIRVRKEGHFEINTESDLHEVRRKKSESKLQW